MIKKTFILFLASLFLFNPAFLYSGEPLSLNTLIEEAKKNNPEILTAKKRWEASLARVPQAKSLDNPTIGLTFEKIPKGTLKLNETMPDDRIVTFSQFIPL